MKYKNFEYISNGQNRLTNVFKVLEYEAKANNAIWQEKYLRMNCFQSALF